MTDSGNSGIAPQNTGGDYAPHPDFGVKVDASVLGEITTRLSALEHAASKFDGDYRNALDKQLALLRELPTEKMLVALAGLENRLLGIESAVKRATTFAECAEREAKDVHTTTRASWQERGKQADAQGELLLRMAKKIDGIETVLMGLAQSLADTPARASAEPVRAGALPEVQVRHQKAIFYNGQQFGGLPPEVDDRTLRRVLAVPSDHALVEVRGDGVEMERVLDGETVEITEGKRFVSLPNEHFVPRR